MMEVIVHGIFFEGSGTLKHSTSSSLCLFSPYWQRLSAFWRHLALCKLKIDSSVMFSDVFSTINYRVDLGLQMLITQEFFVYINISWIIIWSSKPYIRLSVSCLLPHLLTSWFGQIIVTVMSRLGKLWQTHKPLIKRCGLNWISNSSLEANCNLCKL